MNEEPKTLLETVAEPLSPGTRLDAYIAEHLGLFSRSQVRQRVLSVLVDDRPAKLSRRLNGGERLEIRYTDPPPPEARPEAIALEVLYEDGNVIVVNKPAGLVVHPASGNWSGTLVNALLHHSSQLASRFGAGTMRAGIVHRLDKDTSGVIIAAKNPETQEFLARQFRERRAAKQYLAVLKGRLPAAGGTVDTRLGRDPRNRKRFACLPAAGPVQGGKRAVTRYRRLRALGEYTFASLHPLTGRTHQLRVHMSSLGAPILGDSLYGGGRRDCPLMLHAYRLRILLPGEESPRTFRAPLPGRFRSWLRQARPQRPDAG